MRLARNTMITGRLGGSNVAPSGCLAATRPGQTAAAGGRRRVVTWASTPTTQVATQTTPAPTQQASPAAPAPAPPLPSWLQRLLPLGAPSSNAAAGRRGIQHISAGELDALLAAARQEPLLILFSATWCGPCKIMVQRLEALLQDGTLPPATVVKVDVELEDELATRLKVYKLPTLMVVGMQQDPAHPALRLQGLATSTALLDMVQNRAAHLGANLEEAILW